MLMLSVQDIQNLIASEVDQSATAPTAGGTDWNIRLNYINRSLFDWANANDWEALKKVSYSRISTSTGNASVALPGDFGKLDALPKIVSDGSTTYDFPAVDPSDNSKYTESDKFVNVFSTAKVMYVHADQLVSGASVQLVYYASPATVSSASQTTECPDPTYLVQRSLYYLYKSREDGRFPEAKVEADRILARMIENESSLGKAYVDRKITTSDDKLSTFRLGRD